MSTYTEGGRGRKQCPGCQKYVGGKTAVCPECNHEFVKGAKPVAKPKDKDEPVVETPGVDPTVEVGGFRQVLVATPAYDCPVKLTGTDEESVLRWAAAVRAKAPARYVYLLSALRYWVREFYPISGPNYGDGINPEYAEVQDHLTGVSSQ